MTEHLYGEAQEIKTDKDARKHGATDVELWIKKLRRQLKEDEAWRKQGECALKIFEGDEKTAITNLYHSNVATMVPSLYNSSPIPDARRRFGDADPVAKDVSEIIERTVSYIIDQMPFDAIMKDVVTDSVVPGRGLPRIRYIADVEDIEKRSEALTLEVVPWDKFIMGPGRSWDKVPWIAFPLDLTFDEMEKLGVDPEHLERIGVGLSSPLEDEDGGDNDEDDDAQKGIYKTIEVYEIWDKRKRETLFITPRDKDKPLLVLPDVLELPEFFPVPMPLQQVRRRSSMKPICPYELYKDLLSEFNKISLRINALVKQLKVKGLYDGSLNADVSALASEDMADGEFKVAENTSAFLQGSGKTLEAAIAFWPIDKIIAVLQQLYVQRDQLKQLIYEVTGLSDILRGASNPNETATAQQIKTQWGSLRLQDMQAEVARLARDLFRMISHVVAKHFDWQRIKAMTGMDFAPKQPPEMLPDAQPEQQQMALQQAKMQAMQHEKAVEALLRDEMSSFRIDIESDSTVRSDMTRNMEQMNQFLGATSQYAQAVGGLVQTVPQALPTATEIFISFARNFRLGKTAEDALESLSQLAAQAAQQPQEDPEQAKMAAEMQAAQLKAQTDQQKAQADIALKQMDMQLKQMDIRLKEMELQMKQVEGQNMGAELDIKRQGMDLEHAHKMRMADLEHAATARKADTEIGITKKKGDVELDQSINQAAVKREMANTELSAKKTGSAIDMKAKAKKAGVKGKVAADDGLEPDPTLVALGQMIQTGQQATLQGLAEIGKKLDAPRVVNVKRDKSGRIAGAESTVAG
jgi:hypothetical protein